jgi:dTMP kinase
MTSPRGRFIVLEGIDGSGTTTQTQRLAEQLRHDGREVVTTCEPSAGPVGALIRQALARRLRTNDSGPVELDWTTLALLFAADRTDHVARCIEPALQKGADVVCDRYDLSSYIYQSLTAPEPEQALTWVRILNARVPRPDLTLVLNVDFSVAEARRARRGGEPELFERRSLQQRLALAYKQSADYVPNDRLVQVNGEVPVNDLTRELHSQCVALG